MLLSLLVFATFQSRFGRARAGEGAVKPVTAGGPAQASEGETVTDARTDRLLRFGQNFNMIAVVLALAWLLGGPLIDAERRADDPVNLEPAIGGADPEGCGTPTHRCQRRWCALFVPPAPLHARMHCTTH